MPTLTTPVPKGKSNQTGKVSAPKESAKEEQVASIGSGHKRIRALYTCNPGYEPTAECFCVRFSPDDQYLAASFANGAIHVYSTNTGKQEFVLNSAEGKEGTCLPTTQLRWRPHSAQSKTKSVLISVSAEDHGQICHWHIKSGKCLNTIVEKDNQINCLDYFNDGSLFATAGRDRVVRVYDEASKRLVSELQGGDLDETAGHSNRVFAVKFHPEEPHVLVSGGWDKTVQVWDTRKKHSVRSIWNCYICGDALDFSADGHQLLTGSCRHQDSLQVWDFGKGEVVEDIAWKTTECPTNCMLFCAQFSKDPTNSMIMAGGSNENEARFYHRANSTAAPFGALTNLPKPIFSVDFSPNSRMAAIGSADGQVRVLEVK